MFEVLRVWFFSIDSTTKEKLGATARGWLMCVSPLLYVIAVSLCKIFSRLW